MRFIKYIVFCVLMTLGFVYNGELYIFYLDNVQENYYQTNFAFEEMADERTDNEIKYDFMTAAKKNDVDIFMIKSQTKSAYEKEITIYGTKGALESLKNRGVKEQQVKSMFLGNVEVDIEPYENIQDIKSYSTCYLISEYNEYENLSNFKKDLINDYGGGFPRLYGSEKETTRNILSVWIVIFLIIIGLNYYEITFKRKEVCLKIVLGEDVRIICLKNSLYDIIIFSFIFYTTLFFTNNYTNSLFRFNQILKCYVIFIFLVIIVNMLHLFVNYKKALSRSYKTKKVLLATYCFKLVSSIVATVLLANNFFFINQGIEMIRQKAFFEEHKEYSYYRLNYKISAEKNVPLWKNDLVNLSFYQEFFDDALQYVDLTRHFGSIYPIMVINENTLKEVYWKSDIFQDFGEVLDSGAAFILYPDKIEKKSNEYEYAQVVFKSFFSKQYNVNYKEYWYEDDISITAINNSLGMESSILDNPIVIVSKDVIDTKNIIAEDVLGYRNGDIALSTMYKVKDNEFEKFCQDHNLQNQIVVKSNVWDVYQYNLNIMLRSMYINIILSILIILLEILMIGVIIRIEYQVNSIEIFLKKILGYTVWEIHKKIICMAIINALIAALTGIILGGTIEIDFFKYLIMAGIIILLINLILVLYNARNIEAKNINQVLKGEII